MSRPRCLIVVLGTGTEIGKTWVTVALAGCLRSRGLTVAARKPAQSFAPHEVGATDADLLAAATCVDAATVCPTKRWYPTPMAPPMAADALGRSHIALDDLIAETVWPAPTVDVGLVETAGGPCSPIAHDGDGIDLAVRLEPDHVVLVADAGLGTISAVRLAASSLAHRGAPTPHVHLNRYDPDEDIHRRNREWLESDGPEPTIEIDDLARHLGTT